MVRLTYTESPHIAQPANRLEKALSPGEAALSFEAYDDLLTDLIRACPHHGDRVVAIGLVTPETAIAIDRADHRLDEHLGLSPFVGEIDSVLSAPLSQTACIYISNPNRVTGATFALADLELLARAIPHGSLIVDESFVDQFGQTARTLIAENPNIVVLQSSPGSAGQLFGAVTMLNRLDLRTRSGLGRLPVTATAGSRSTENIEPAHNEALRIAEGLSTLGIQARLSPTDFVLIRVFDPTSVGNALARAGVPFENLHGYPHLAHYLKYRISSFEANSHLMDTFARMPLSWHRIPRTDRRASTLHRDGEERVTVYETPDRSAPPALRRVTETMTP